MTLKPLGDRVVLEKIQKPDISPGGVILTQNSKEDLPQGTVLACGYMTDEADRGDRVVYTPYSASEVKIDGKEFIIISEKNILAKIV